jgi:hypothetical protein
LQAVAKHIYGTLRNSSVVMSNLIGPVEPMALANHPVKGLYFIMSGAPEVTIILSLACYLKTILDSNFFLQLITKCVNIFLKKLN